MLCCFFIIKYNLFNDLSILFKTMRKFFQYAIQDIKQKYNSYENILWGYDQMR